MNIGNFYEPESVKPLYGEIVPTYQKAFACPPWNEVSACPDDSKRCEGGLSAVAVGNLCEVCNICPIEPAYPAAGLINRFEKATSGKAAQWYIESNDDGLTLAALAWKAKPSEIAQIKYPDVTVMNEWMQSLFRTPWDRLVKRLGRKPKERDIVWLDEVFANRDIKPNGNLRNFGAFVIKFAELLDAEFVAYRTIEPKMIKAAVRDFGDRAMVYKPRINVPDRRTFVLIDTMITETVVVPTADCGLVGYQKVRRKVPGGGL